MAGQYDKTDRSESVTGVVFVTWSPVYDSGNPVDGIISLTLKDNSKALIYWVPTASHTQALLVTAVSTCVHPSH